MSMAVFGPAVEIEGGAVEGKEERGAEPPLLPVL